MVLIGPSMGGGIIVNFLYRSALADHVRAAILEAPMLDFGAVIDFGAERRNLPPLLTWLGKTVAGWRFGIDWNALDYVAQADRLRVPILCSTETRIARFRSAPATRLRRRAPTSSPTPASRT